MEGHNNTYQPSRAVGFMRLSAPAVVCRPLWKHAVFYSSIGHVRQLPDAWASLDAARHFPQNQTAWRPVEPSSRGPELGHGDTSSASEPSQFREMTFGLENPEPF
jgi:hypothetical protein